MSAWVYILASKPYETLYTGVTNHLARRVYEHREKQIEGFTRKYSVRSLVWYQEFYEFADAIQMEKRIKR
ncbi:GIY-YIG nuclease family protein [Roseibium denhamense]|uniref:Endonuclease n=1 Tax=Roseibium denhamense TaxID=76305 RepID=A0ABY1NP71_9HYPH|nr:putative endonuclease [Roseibium denhamense]